MENKPVIGILPLWDEERESLWMLPGYMNGIIKAGGCPFMLPLTDDKDMISQFVSMCDGFLFTGGQDVSPDIYNSAVKYNSVIPCRERDEMELLLLKEALIRDKSILGICRGIQLINAVLGGTLYQDLPTETNSNLEHHQNPPYDVPAHKVLIEKNSPLFELLQTTELAVNSYHHQAVKALSPKLTCMAKATDEIVEAVYMPNKNFVWAVQWHPEFSYLSNDSSMKIFNEFIKNSSTK